MHYSAWLEEARRGRISPSTSSTLPERRLALRLTWPTHLDALPFPSGSIPVSPQLIDGVSLDVTASFAVVWSERVRRRERLPWPPPHQALIQRACSFII
jgi:hypothetical protein